VPKEHTYKAFPNKSLAEIRPSDLRMTNMPYYLQLVKEKITVSMDTTEVMHREDLFYFIFSSLL
jgi:hypothetical protein